MSVNHYSTDHHHYNTLMWQHHHTTDTHPPETATTTTTTTSTWLNEDQKESLFEKTLTPSDVGKLNRLVIPKQHAEKYFPLNTNITNNAADTSSSEKGMLLSFEDESGKCWRFRYSYWNSSQSYVLTKGWSRFVKDKHLDPGDVVLFQRQRSHSPRLFIGWRRRGQVSSSSSSAGVNTTSYSSPMAPPYLQLQASSNNYSNPPSHSEYSHYGAAVVTAAETHSSIPSSSAVTGSSKTVRLFGVNLECQMDEDDGDVAATAAAVDCTDGYYGQNMYYYYSPHPHNMNIAFTGDTMKQLGDRRG